VLVASGTGVSAEAQPAGAAHGAATMAVISKIKHSRLRAAPAPMGKLVWR
jgi:hypothetical protein